MTFSLGSAQRGRRGRGPAVGIALVAVLSVGIVGAGALVPAPVADAATEAAPSTTLSVPTAYGHRARHGAVPRRTSDVAGVDALGHVTAAGVASRRATSASRKLITYGGGLTTGGLVAAGVTTGQPRVFVVFMGAQWGAQSTNGAGQDVFSGDPDGFAPALQALYAGIGTDGETWSGVMTQYCDGAATGATSCQQGDTMIPYPSPDVLAGVWYDDSGAATAQESAGLTEHQLAAEAEAAALHFGHPDQASNRDAQYVIVSPTGTDPDGWENRVSGYCAYHDDTHDSSIDGGGPVSGPILAFTNLPYVPDAGSGCGAGLVNQPGILDGATSSASHEYAETITDQFPEGDPVPGWINAAGNEIADICAYVTSGPGALFDLRLSTGTVAVQGLWSNRADGGRGSCEDGEPDFTFTPSLASVSARSGTAGSLVTVVGDNLLGVTSVDFAGTPATIVGDSVTSVSVLVPTGAANGTITVTSPLGTVSTAKPFYVAPSIASVAPGAVVPGESVVITGSGLASTKRVSIGGRKSPISSESPTRLVVTVPRLAATGPVVVSSKYGSATSTVPVTVT